MAEDVTREGRSEHEGEAVVLCAPPHSQFQTTYPSKNPLPHQNTANPLIHTICQFCKYAATDWELKSRLLRPKQTKARY